MADTDPDRGAFVSGVPEGSPVPRKAERLPSPVAFTDAERVPCTICGKPTRMLGTKLCDGCWELRTRIERDPDIAHKILNNLEAQS
jgi:hypothetical protein